jgi:hypothetical protein
MDWVAHLRQSLVFDPVPTFLTFLIVCAHLHACCLGDEANDTQTTPNNSSVVGSVFTVLARHNILRRGCIETPFSGTKRASKLPDPSGQPSPAFTDQILSAAMTDPMTMMYDAWSYLSSTDSLNTGESNHQAPGQCGAPREGEEEDQRSVAPGAVWTDICTMHLVGMAGLTIMLLPSIFNQSMLACNAIQGVKSSAWPVLNSSLCILGISWTWCCAMNFVLGLPRLALCTAMHSVGRIMLSYASTSISCPLPPIFMPGAVASGLGVFVGALLLCISHVHGGAVSNTEESFKANGRMVFNTQEFYMNHAWACVCILMCMRHTVFRVGMCMHGRGFMEG